MCRFPVGAAQQLRSVSLRYCQPLAWMVVGPNRGLAVLFSCERSDEGPKLSGDGLVQPAPLARLEAILFLTREPLGSRKLAELADLADGTKARTLVRALNRRYDAVGSAFRVEEVAGGFQLLTRPKFAPWLRRLQAAAAEVRLSGPAMETLAVVAYRQPVLRAEIEAIRGVQCGEILRQLIERDLVRIVGRSQELGRPLLYGTTRQFLQVFGLRHIEDLPQTDFLPMTKRVAEGVAPRTAPEASEPIQLIQYPSSEDREENEMKTLLDPKALPEADRTPGLAGALGSNFGVRSDRDLENVARDADEDDVEDDDADDDDDDLDDEDDEWEEVDDEDDDFEDDEDWEEDEDWDEDDDEDDDLDDEDDDDWEDDDWEEDDDEKGK
jgi:segregation and condensation protein B